jgi:hypothetical protein
MTKPVKEEMNGCLKKSSECFGRPRDKRTAVINIDGH